MRSAFLTRYVSASIVITALQTVAIAIERTTFAGETESVGDPGAFHAARSSVRKFPALRYQATFSLVAPHVA